MRPQADPRSAAERPHGTTVDHFQLVRRIGAGGMGEVYLARDTVLGRLVALKFILRRRASAGAIARFRDEARTTASLNHPHIVQVYAFGEHQGSPYIVMEYLKGGSLAERLREGPLAPAEVRRLGAAMAGALATAHEASIIHRDLKPANVLLPPDGRPRIVDFGLGTWAGAPPAGAAEASPSPDDTEPDEDTPSTLDLLEGEDETRPGPRARLARREVAGTPRYMAPEQWRGDAARASDVWALGLVLWEALTSRSPYAGLSRDELRAAVTSDAPVPLGPPPPGPSALVEVIEGCLRKDPAERASAEEIRDALHALELDDAPSVEDPFPGLRSFTEGESGAFHGREDEIAICVERLRHEVVLPVVGRSGAGKSSFIRAGVIPRLRERGRWEVLQMRPGAAPFRALAALMLERGTDSQSGRPDVALDRLAADLEDNPVRLGLKLWETAEREDAHVLLFVDQLEELYTHVDDPEVRARFLAALTSAVVEAFERVRIVLTIRDDFLGHLPGTARVREAFANVLVLPLPDARALREIATAPLRARGYRFDDPGLLDEIIAAIDGEPTRLSLLQFTLRTLWARRDREARQLRREVYDEIGGVEGALATHADGVLAGMSEAQLETTRHLLLRLVSGEGTRRSVPRSALLAGLGPDAGAILERLLDHRLVAARRRSRGEEEPRIELAHESMMVAWRRLADWIAEGRGDLSLLADLADAAHLWDRRGRTNDELWEGDALAEARRRVERATAPVGDAVRDFLAASRAFEEKTRRRRRLGLAIVLACLGLAAVVSVAAAIGLAEEQRRTELARSEAVRRGNELLVESAWDAWERGAMLEARARLRTALEEADSTASRMLAWHLAGEPIQWSLRVPHLVNSADVSSDGERVLLGSHDRNVYLLDGPTTLRVVATHSHSVYAAALDPSSERFATADVGGEVRVGHLDDLERSATLGHHRGAVYALAFDPDGERLASGGEEGLLRVWDPAREREVAELQGHGVRLAALAFAPDGRLASADVSGAVLLWDLGSDEAPRTVRSEGPSVGALAFDPSSTQLAVGDREGGVRVYALDDPGAPPRRGAVSEPVSSLAFDAESDRLVVGTTGGRLHELGGGALDLRVARALEGGWAVRLRYVSDGLIAVQNGRVRHLRLEVARRSIEPPRMALHGVAFGADGSILAVGAEPRIARWDARTGALLEPLPAAPDGFAIAVARSEDLVAVGGHTRVVQIFQGGGASSYELAVGADVRALELGREAQELFVATRLGPIERWSLETRQRTGRLVGHEGTVWSLAASADGETLYSVGVDGTVREWDLASGAGRELARLEAPLFALDRHDATGRLAVSDFEGRVHLVEGELETLGSQGAPSWGLAFHPDGDRLAAVAGGQIHLWDLVARTRVSAQGHRLDANRVAFSPDGGLLVATGDDGILSAHHTENLEPAWITRGLTDRPLASLTHLGWARRDGASEELEPARWRAAMAERARWVAARGETVCGVTTEGRLELWDRASDERLAALALDEPPRRLDVAAGRCVVDLDGELRAVGDGDDRLLASDVDAFAVDGASALLVSGHELLEVDPATGETTTRAALRAVAPAAAIGAVEGGAVVAYRDGLVEHRPDGAAPRVIDADRPSRVSRLVPGPARTIAVGYLDGAVELWDLGSRRRLGQWALHGPVTAIRAEGGRLVAASELGDVRSWDLSLLEMPYCEVLRRVWEQSPRAWLADRATVAAPPREHACR